MEIQAGGKVQATGGPAALISITGAPGAGTSAGITFNNGNVSTPGFVDLTANGGSIAEAADTGPDVTAADGATFTTTGSNSAIGTSTDPIRTAIGALTATTNDGGVYIADSNGPGLIINLHPGDGGRKTSDPSTATIRSSSLIQTWQRIPRRDRRRLGRTATGRGHPAGERPRGGHNRHRPQCGHMINSMGGNILQGVAG